MKLATKYAGISASGAFVLISYTGFFTTIVPTDILDASLTGGIPPLNTMKILQVLAWGALGAVVAGYFGHTIGNIMANPKGEEKKTSRELAEQKVLSALEGVAAPDGLAEEGAEGEAPLPEEALEAEKS